MVHKSKIVSIPTYDVSFSEACHIVKYSLDDDSVALRSKILAIEKVSEMETYNSITKNELVSALRWIFAHYDFDG